jgi:transcriptional regulator with XRE-family HTH domain
MSDPSSPVEPPISPLRAWRLEADLSLEIVAGTARVTRQTLENWERGASSPRVEHLRAMAGLAPGLFAALGLTDSEVA